MRSTALPSSSSAIYNPSYGLDSSGTISILPWFDYYDDNSIAVEGSYKLAGLKCVLEMGEQKKDNPLPKKSVDPEQIVKLCNKLK